MLIYLKVLTIIFFLVVLILLKTNFYNHHYNINLFLSEQKFILKESFLEKWNLYNLNTLDMYTHQSLI